MIVNPALAFLNTSTSKYDITIVSSATIKIKILNILEYEPSLVAGYLFNNMSLIQVSKEDYLDYPEVTKPIKVNILRPIRKDQITRYSGYNTKMKYDFFNIYSNLKKNHPYFVSNRWFIRSYDFLKDNMSIDYYHSPDQDIILCAPKLKKI